MGDHKSKKQAPLPLLTRFKLLLFELIRNACTRPDGSVNRRLFSLIDFKTSAPAVKLVKTIQVSTSDITIDPSHNLWFRLFVPSHAEKLLPLIVYFHGGGFSNYGADSKVYDDLCSRLAAGVPAVIVSVNYRLSPEHKYPSQYEDGFDVLKFIDANIGLPAKNKMDLSKCFIGGDSAGGNIAHHVTVRAVEKAEEFNKIRIIGMVGLQPFFGGEERSESEVRLTKAPLLSVKQTDVFWREFLPEGADRDHPAANVFGNKYNNSNIIINDVDDRFPSSLVVVGGNDPLQDWDRKYVEWLRSCGKTVDLTEYPNAFHGFYAFQELPEFDLLIHRVATFVHKQLT